MKTFQQNTLLFKCAHIIKLCLTASFASITLQLNFTPAWNPVHETRVENREPIPHYSSSYKTIFFFFFFRFTYPSRIRGEIEKVARPSHLNKTNEDIRETRGENDEADNRDWAGDHLPCVRGIEPYRLITIVTKTMVDTDLLSNHDHSNFGIDRIISMTKNRSSFVTLKNLSLSIIIHASIFLSFTSHIDSNLIMID